MPETLPPRTISVAAIQCPLGDDRRTNVDRVLAHIEEAARRGAQVILPPELFEGPYFCRHQDEAFVEWARPLEGNETISKVAALCKKLRVVVPVSFFERAGHAHYNTVAMVSDEGEVMGVYRKSHIPDGPGYMEKFYFRPGDTGFRVWETRFGKLGVGICWDQWYPECARSMALLGAEVLFYPTAIGSEPHDASLDTKDPWQRVMLGHAVANVMPVVAANRIGTEEGQKFYGSSFIANHRGDKVEELDREAEGVIVHTFDLAFLHRHRAAWGFFRDRRPELYGPLATADGKLRV